MVYRLGCVQRLWQQRAECPLNPVWRRRPGETRWNAFWRIWLWPLESTWARALVTVMSATAATLVVLWLR